MTGRGASRGAGAKPWPPAHAKKAGDEREGNMETNEVLVHFNVKVTDDPDPEVVKMRAVVAIYDAAHEGREAFMELVALVDPQ